jgi:hypothetical protein
MNSQWASEPIIVDGDASDWMNALIVLQEHEGTAFGITNDSNNIYLIVRSRDDKWVRTVRMGGLTLWFNGDGKHKYWAVKYYGGPSADQMAASMPTERSGSGGAPDDDRINRMADMLSRNENRLTVVDKYREIEEDISVSGSAGPSAAYSFSDGLYNYEFSIPLDYTDSLHGPRGLALGENISICAEWGEMQNGERRERPAMSLSGMGRSGGKEVEVVVVVVWAVAGNREAADREECNHPKAKKSGSNRNWRDSHGSEILVEWFNRGMKSLPDQSSGLIVK